MTGQSIGALIQLAVGQTDAGIIAGSLGLAVVEHDGHGIRRTRCLLFESDMEALPRVARGFIQADQNLRSLCRAEHRQRMHRLPRVIDDPLQQPLFVYQVVASVYLFERVLV